MKGGKEKEKGVHCGYHYQILLLSGETEKRSIAIWLSFGLQHQQRFVGTVNS